MTPRQIEIIQSRFAEVRPIPDRVGARFYSRLFQMAPETRAMFKNDMVEQRRKLIETLALIADALDRVETVLPAVRDLAVRHRAYGVEDDHYSLVGLALIETLREMLGPVFDGEVEQAWRDAYSFVAGAMIEASHGTPSKAPPQPRRSPGDKPAG